MGFVGPWPPQSNQLIHLLVSSIDNLSGCAFFTSLTSVTSFWLVLTGGDVHHSWWGVFFCLSFPSQLHLQPAMSDPGCRAYIHRRSRGVPLRPPTASTKLSTVPWFLLSGAGLREVYRAAMHVFSSSRRRSPSAALTRAPAAWCLIHLRTCNFIRSEVHTVCMKKQTNWVCECVCVCVSVHWWNESIQANSKHISLRYRRLSMDAVVCQLRHLQSFFLAFSWHLCWKKKERRNIC